MAKVKKWFEKIGYETALAGIFGVIAIVAVFFEMAIAGFDTASIAGGVKDIAGTILAVVMLIIAARALRPRKRKAEGFETKFEENMKKIISKYSPLIQKDEEVKGRYNIADNMMVLYQDAECRYHRMFEFNYRNELSFIVSKTLFMGKSKEDFTPMRENIVNSITNKVKTEFSDILNSKFKITQDGFTLTTNRDLLTEEDADRIAEVIDKVILLYIVEYKK